MESKPKILILLALGMLALPLREVAWFESYPGAESALQAVAVLAPMAGFALLMRGLWLALPREYASLPATQAWIGMVVPILDRIWALMVLPRFADDYERWAEEQDPEAPELSRRLCQVQPALLLTATAVEIAGAVAVAIPLYLAAYALLMALAVRMSEAVDCLLDHEDAPEHEPLDDCRLEPISLRLEPRLEAS